MEDEDSAGVRTWLVSFEAPHSVSKPIRPGLRGTDLGEADSRVLDVLLHKGAQPVIRLGPKVNLTPGSISVAVDRLNGRGLVGRVDAASLVMQKTQVEFANKSQLSAKDEAPGTG